MVTMQGGVEATKGLIEILRGQIETVKRDPNNWKAGGHPKRSIQAWRRSIEKHKRTLRACGVPEAEIATL